MRPRVNICWLRRDLRLHDQAALYHALRKGIPVIVIFIFDRHILDELDDPQDRRMTFIYTQLEKINQQLIALGSSLITFYDTPLDAFQKLIQQFHVQEVYTNRDYEPYARKRDEQIATFLQEKGMAFYDFKDQVIFDRDEILKSDGTPYTVYTPYSKQWKQKLNTFYLQSYPVEQYLGNLFQMPAQPLPPLESMGFQRLQIAFPPEEPDENIIRHYHEWRDYPAMNGTTKMSVHLRFGTISIRELVRKARALNEKYLNELIWREFYQMILWHFPHVVHQCFKPEYDRIEWLNDEEAFRRWCEGRTGCPMVDAGMRQLNATGYMHNRLRMITASYLTKNLLIDWRWGEAYFAKQLLDYDLASNNGGWQWSAGCGCDAAPYFRLFNPDLQAQRFDPDYQFIKQWVPEYGSPEYPAPLISHQEARKRCLDAYARALQDKMKPAH
ncbi:cryptochrome/photolyase family protein [Thermoflavifilum thermophilum]|uniref:Deoxyribodipyrimidine photo-lyase n=1 Tax=Thermoflavifilum thermophilum TaxID=1393122 RepID=A0A1I7N4P6_9BACT|nr:deoxyribodipyrimidine photo-lyase [Thermoflavifilum thermophilum]SFV29556.1 deoxyribodipyrimidine photo-lyase [Thermoflavifilum thermophilum]